LIWQSTAATTLGSGGMTINPSGTTLRTWSFATIAAPTATTGDRLLLRLVYGSGKACNSLTLHYDAAATPSSVTVPAMP
jgi:hypothetical protein